MDVVIEPPREEWGRELTALASRLAAALGDPVVRIDHIGSTAVPGLPAKDVIDVQVIVPSLDPAAELTAAFASIGFAPKLGAAKLRDHVPAGWEGEEAAWDKLLFGPPEGERASNIHVRVSGSPNERYALLFRDFLRSNDRARDLWGSFKERLAVETRGDRELYADLKDPATDVLLVSAEEWARGSGWTVASASG
jgi:dephospho-CoA kinase